MGSDEWGRFRSAYFTYIGLTVDFIVSEKMLAALNAGSSVSRATEVNGIHVNLVLNPPMMMEVK